MSSRIDEVSGEPQTVADARDAVERSRQRMSSTIDKIEDRIVEKKHEIQDRVDIARPLKDQVAQRPFTVVAVALGVGALLGSLGGGSDSDSGRGSRDSSGSDGILSREERKELREWRKHRREHMARLESSRDDSSRSSSSGSGTLDSMKHQLMGAVTTAIGSVVTAKVREFTSGSQTERPSRLVSDPRLDYDRSTR